MIFNGTWNFHGPLFGLHGAQLGRGPAEALVTPSDDFAVDERGPGARAVHNGRLRREIWKEKEKKEKSRKGRQRIHFESPKERLWLLSKPKDFFKKSPAAHNGAHADLASIFSFWSVGMHWLGTQACTHGFSSCAHALFLRALGALMLS